MREHFEKWYLEQTGLRSNVLWKDGDNYGWDLVQMLWKAWQAGAANALNEAGS